ncbi:MAG: hypothetical protein ACLQVI_17270 [Polyangiaceae bacterium]
MTHAGPPPDPRVLELLRTLPTPPAGARDRVRAKLIAAGSGPGGHEPGNDGGARSGTTVLGLGKGPLVTLALLIGGVGGALLHSALTRPPAPLVVYVDRPIAVTAADSETTTAASAPSLEVPTLATAVAPATRAPSPSAGPSQLAAERAVLDEARAALVGGDAARALDRLGRHRRLFLNPMLAEERDAMEVEALVRAGRSTEARARAEAFHRHSPNSLFMPTVDSAIASIP